MATLEIRAALKYDPKMMHNEDMQGYMWFVREVLMKELLLHSNETGDNIGDISIFEVRMVSDD